MCADQCCFVMFKPDAYEHGIVDTITQAIESLGYKIHLYRELHVSEQEVLGIWPNFYTEEWWRATVDYLQRGKVGVGVVVGAGVSGKLCDLKRSLRARYPGSHKVVSVIHTSDNDEELKRNLLTFWEWTELQGLFEENAIDG